MQGLYQGKGEKDTGDLLRYLERKGQMVLPLIDLLESSRAAVERLLQTVCQNALEALLLLSAEAVAGKKHQGQAGGDLSWHGFQAGRVTLSDRQVKVKKPRLRRKGQGEGGEVEIPAYRALNAEGIGARVLEILMNGVSTRKYEKVLPEAAEAVGISRSSISREFIAASAEELKELLERPLGGKRFLAIFLDGVFFGPHSVICAVGVDEAGYKQVLGLAGGATENSESVKSLLLGLVERGLDPHRRYLFVIDGGKALAKGIEEIFGARQLLQRCRQHKVRNVCAKLPKEYQDQTWCTMGAAWRLKFEEGMARMRKLGEWLEPQYPDAARSLREGLEETFTINRLGLSSTLRRGLGTTNVIESNFSGMKQRTRRVCNWASGEMAQRWAAAALLETEKHFRRIQGFKDLWMLKAVLDQDEDLQIKEQVA